MNIYKLNLDHVLSCKLTDYNPIFDHYNTFFTWFLIIASFWGFYLKTQPNNLTLIWPEIKLILIKCNVPLENLQTEQYQIWVLFRPFFWPFNQNLFSGEPVKITRQLKQNYDRLWRNLPMTRLTEDINFVWILKV